MATVTTKSKGSSMTQTRNTRDLAAAIRESRTFNRIVTVYVQGGSIGDVMTDIREVIDAYDECDYSQENDGQYDVYGWNAATAENEHEWRLCVHIVRHDAE